MKRNIARFVVPPYDGSHDLNADKKIFIEKRGEYFHVAMNAGNGNLRWSSYINGSLKYRL